MKKLKIMNMYKWLTFFIRSQKIKKKLFQCALKKVCQMTKIELLKDVLKIF